MIKFLGTIPNTVAVACSGGVDSMAILSFLKNGKKDVSCLYFNHGTRHSINTEQFVVAYCKENNIPCIVGHIKNEKHKSESLEEYWRNERYKFFNSIDLPIITCHHVDDVVETWLFTCMNGNPFLIPYKNKNIIRPFLITEKQDFINWCNRKNVPWRDDHSNIDVKYARNRIRHNIVPQVKMINPGINKVIIKKLNEEFKNYSLDK
jgi:tRNA(Ile)-lysidine synthase